MSPVRCVSGVQFLLGSVCHQRHFAMPCFIVIFVAVVWWVVAQRNGFNVITGEFESGKGVIEKAGRRVISPGVSDYTKRESGVRLRVSNGRFHRSVTAFDSSPRVSE